MLTSKAKQGIHSLLPTCRQMFSYHQESSAPLHLMVSWGDKCRNSEVARSSFFPHLFWLSTTLYDVGYPFGQLGSAVPALSRPSFLCTLSLLARGVAWETQKSLMLHKHCSARLKHPCVISTVLVINPKHSTVASQLLWRKCILSQPKSVQ